MFLTLKEAAVRAGVHENTARFYRDKFEHYFQYAGKGRNRRYAPSTIDLLKKIRECYNLGMEAATIEDSLENRAGTKKPAICNDTEVKDGKQPGNSCETCEKYIQLARRIDRIESELDIFSRKLNESRENLSAVEKLVNSKLPIKQGEHLMEMLQFHHSQIKEILVIVRNL